MPISATTGHMRRTSGFHLAICTLLGALFSTAALAGTHTAGTPSAGQTYWQTTGGCAACHTNTTTKVPDATAFTNQPVSYYATNPANFQAGLVAANSTSMDATNPSGPTFTAGSNAANTVANANDLSAYFASLQTPVLTTPSFPSAFNSGATFTDQIASASTSDYLVSTTTYSATLVSGTPAFTITPSATGGISVTLPTVSAVTTYTINYSATNAAAGTGSTSNFTITVNPPAPVVSSAATASGTVGVTYSAGSPLYAITASNSPTSYSVSSGSLPPGASLSGANVVGVPTTVGTFAPTLAAANVTGTGTKVVTFTIAKGNQTLSFGAAPATVVVNPLSSTGSVSASSLNASSQSTGLAITYSVPTTTSICSVNASTGAVTGLSVGTCTIAANQAGNANYNAATQVTQNVTVNMGSQTITLGTAPATVVVNTGASTGSVSASATPSALAVSYSVPTTTSICSVNSTTGAVTGLAVGTCTVAVDQAGDGNYFAAPQVTQNITVNKGSQTITNMSVPVSLTVGNSGSVSATGGAGTQAVVFSSLTTGICTVSGTTVNAIAAGTCTIAANQAADTNYNAATQVTQNFAVGLNPQTITFGAAPTMTFGGGTATVSASGGASGNPVTFSVPVTTTICSVSGNVVTALAAGTCTVAADQAGSSAYAAASQVTQNITINKASQSITFNAAPTVVVNGTGAVSATGGASGNAVTFTSLTTAVCTVSGTNGSTVTGVATGTCTIAANQAGNGNYNAATQVTQSFSVGKGSQTITFGAAPAILFGGTGTVSATATSTGTVTFSSQTGTICSVSGNVVSGLNAGSCTIAANQAGDANYNPAPQATQTFSIGQLGQTIFFGAAPSLVVGGTATVGATGGSSGNTVTFSSLTAGICSVSGTTVRGLAVGTCTVAANQAGNGNYSSAAQVTQNIAVGQGSQTITFGTAPSLAVGGTAAITVTGGPSTSPVVLSSTTAGICTISGTTVTGVSAGTCTIAANQAADANYTAAAQVTQNITVVNLPPTVAAASMSTTLNTTATFDLAPFITGFGVTGVTIFAQPAHGTLSTAGTKVSYTPNKDYFGNDSFAYKAYAAGGLVSTSAATVTVTITGRPDPLKDARVTGLVNVQTAAVKRFGTAQVFNFQQRLESRHHAMYAPMPLGAPGDASNTPAPVGGALPSQGANYFNSWQPGTALAYANNPDTLLHAASTGGGSAVTTPTIGNVMGLVANALTSSTLNLGAISSIVGASADETFNRLEFWAAGSLRFGSRSQSGVDTQFTTDGISVGVDKRLDRKLTAGMGMGYARDKSNIGSDGTNSSSSGNSVAGYASYQMDNGTFLDGLLGYGKVSFDTNRYVAAVNDFARATRSGDQLFGSLSFGYEYRKDAVMWSPYGRFDFSFNRLDAGTESGAGTNALSYASQNTRISHLSFGVRAQSAHQTSYGVAQPRVRFEYQHGLEASSQTAVAYADLPGVLYAVPGTSQNTNAAVLGLGSDFLLSDTLRVALDYQRLRSNGFENYQSISFRLTKDINGKNDLDTLLEDSYESSIDHPSGFVVATGFAYDNNVSRASASADRLADSIFSLTLSKAGAIPLSRYTRLALSGFMDVEKFRNHAGLGHLSGGVQGEYMYRPSGEYGSPTYGVFVRYTADQYESALRDGSHYSVGVTLRDPLTDRISLFAAVAENTRSGKSAVFDTHDVSGRANLDYALAAGQTLYLTGEYRKGDIVSSGRPSLAILDTAKVFIRDDAFAVQGFFAYRMPGQTTLLTCGYNHSFGAKDSLDLAWRHAQATPDTTPAYAAPVRYIDNLYSITYLMAF